MKQLPNPNEPRERLGIRMGKYFDGFAEGKFAIAGLVIIVIVLVVLAA